MDINSLRNAVDKLKKQGVKGEREILKALQEMYGDIPTRELYTITDELRGSRLSAICDRELERVGLASKPEYIRSKIEPRTGGYVEEKNGKWVIWSPAEPGTPVKVCSTYFEAKHWLETRTLDNW